MLNELNRGGGVFVKYGGRFEAAVQVVVCCTESLLSPSERLILKRLVARPKN